MTPAFDWEVQCSEANAGTHTRAEHRTIYMLL